jgi:hypothetical protein
MEALEWCRARNRACKRGDSDASSIACNASEDHAQNARHVVRHEIQQRGTHLTQTRDLRRSRTLTRPTSLAANRRQRALREFVLRQDEVFLRLSYGGGTLSETLATATADRSHNIKCHGFAKKFSQKKHVAEIFPWACTRVEQSADRSGKRPAHAAICCPRRNFLCPRNAGTLFE